MQMASLVVERRLCSAWASVAGALRLSGCGSQAVGSTVVVHSLVAPGHVGSSWIRDQIHVPCIGRQTLYH